MKSCVGETEQAPCEYHWPQGLTSTKNSFYTPLSKWSWCLEGSCGFEGDKFLLSKTMEDAPILPKAAPDLRAYSPDSVQFLAVLETAKSSASLGEGGP